jgi:hypothetical protein
MSPPVLRDLVNTEFPQYLPATFLEGQTEKAQHPPDLFCSWESNGISTLVVRRLHHQMIDDAVGFVDVMQGAIPKPTDARVIFFACNVIVRFIQQFHGAAEAAGAVHAGIDRWMIVQILAIVNRGVLDLLNGAVNFRDGVFFFFIHVMSGGWVFQMSACVTEIGECVQVSGMSSRFVGKSSGGAKCDKKHE